MQTPTDHVRVDETTSEELLALLDRQEEISLVSGQPDAGLPVQLRKRGGVYYCDTSVKLYSFEERDAFLDCLERIGIPRTASAGTEAAIDRSS